MPTDRPRRIGRYEVRDRIGQGGMGVLWLAWDPRLERLVAIKQLWTQNPDVRRRFLREASVAGKLQHPHIVTVYDTAEHEGQPFIAMEYIKGKTVAHMIKTRTAGPIADRLRLMIDLCDGLAFAHRSGVVHRDVKPANLMLNEEDQLKILDFGIARVLDASLTQDGMTLGTPNYMSPEQVQGRPVDHRSDIFAVGLVLYELLSYRQAFPGDSHHMVALKILQEEPEPLLRLMPGLDPELADIVARCLHKAPDERYQDLLEMRRDLESVRDGLVQASTEDTVSVRPPGLAPPPPVTPTPPRFDAEALKRRRQELIDRHLATAENALGDGRLEEAQDAVEAAATLDPDHARVMAVHGRVRAAVARRTADALAAEARGLLAAGSLTESLRRLTDAERAHPAPAELGRLRSEIVSRLEARERERARAQAVDAAMERARSRRQAGDLQAALDATDEALRHDPGNDSARELHDAIEGTLVERQRLEANERLVARQVATCDEALARDDVNAAAAALDACGAIDHPDLAAARTRVRQRETLLARRRQEEEERRRETERQRLAEERRVAEQRAGARQALDNDDPDRALTLLDAVRGPAAEPPDVQALRDEAVAKQVDKRRREQLARLVADATSALAKGDPDRAVVLLAQARELSPTDASLNARYDDARRSADEAEARRKADAHDRAARAAIVAADQAFDRDERQALDRLRAFEPAHPLVDAAIERLAAQAHRREEERAAAERRRQAARIDEEASTAVDAARRDFARGRRAAATQALRAFTPAHPTVSQALQELEAEAARLEAAEREAAERARLEREAHERAAREAAAAIAEARRLFDGGQRGEALARLGAFTGDPALVADAAREMAALAEQHAREEAERERNARDAQERARAQRLRSAAAHLDAGELDAARADVERVLAEVPYSREAAGLMARIVEAVAEREARARAAAEAQSAVADAERLFSSGHVNEAVAALGRFDGDPALVAAALAELTEAAAWRGARATHLARAQAAEQSKQWDDAAAALRAVLEGDRHTSRPPEDARQAVEQLDRVLRAAWHSRLNAAAALVSAERWDDANIALRALRAELDGVAAAWGAAVREPVTERREVRDLLTMVTAALTEREETRQRALEAEREREQRARQRQELFARVRHDFQAGLYEQGLQRLEAAAPGDEVAAVAHARLAADGRPQPAGVDTAGLPGGAHAPESMARLQRIESGLARAVALAREGRRARAAACLADTLRADPSHAGARALMDSLRVSVPSAPGWRSPRLALLQLWDAALLSMRRPRADR